MKKRKYWYMQQNGKYWKVIYHMIAFMEHWPISACQLRGYEGEGVTMKG